MAPPTRTIRDAFRDRAIVAIAADWQEKLRAIQAGRLTPASVTAALGIRTASSGKPLRFSENEANALCAALNNAERK